ncbi:hypothetical protein H5410_041018 [Solanum commersonii]|uniref:Uncharacterized protein n=1 Tax=Solanum commersonii TaxID=4109 RepID=A0A9J5XTM1_SOLCO|nr:hypothetical protein H5410_041018 [Solanum commersonii]
MQNRSVLMKWLWRFNVEVDGLWRNIITEKYRLMNKWCTNLTTPTRMDINLSVAQSKEGNFLIIFRRNLDDWKMGRILISLAERWFQFSELMLLHVSKRSQLRNLWLMEEDLAYVLQCLNLKKVMPNSPANLFLYWYKEGLKKLKKAWNFICMHLEAEE